MRDCIYHVRMLTEPEAIVADLESRAKLAGLTMATVCSRAGVAQSTITRWKAKTYEPTTRKLRKLLAVLDAAEVRSPTSGFRGEAQA